VDQVYGWLTSPQHLSPPSTERISGQEDRVLRCASQEGLAIWYFHELGLVDERVDVLVSRLVDYQWPEVDGTATRTPPHGLRRCRKPCCRCEVWPGTYAPSQGRLPFGMRLTGLPSSC
jgi:hypothetical protein